MFGMDNGRPPGALDLGDRSAQADVARNLLERVQSILDAEGFMVAAAYVASALDALPLAMPDEDWRETYTTGG